MYKFVHKYSTELQMLYIRTKIKLYLDTKFKSEIRKFFNN